MITLAPSLNTWLDHLPLEGYVAIVLGAALLGMFGLALILELIAAWDRRRMRRQLDDALRADAEAWTPRHQKPVAPGLQSDRRYVAAKGRAS